MRFHQQKFLDAVSRLIEQSPLPLWGPVRLDQVMAAYRQHLATPMGKRQAASLYGDCTLLLALCGRESAAGELLSEVLGNSTDQRAFQTFGGREAYERTMREAIAHPGRIERTVSAQIKALAVDHLPTDEFIV